MSLNESLGAGLAVELQELDQAKISPRYNFITSTTSRIEFVYSTRARHTPS